MRSPYFPAFSSRIAYEMAQRRADENRCFVTRPFAPPGDHMIRRARTENARLRCAFVNQTSTRIDDHIAAAIAFAKAVDASYAAEQAYRKAIEAHARGEAA
jgi:hypothetical protein